jgi:rRNA biogenesis protein RRP5
MLTLLDAGSLQIMVMDQDAPSTSKSSKPSKLTSSKAPAAVPTLSLSGGFSWSAADADDVSDDDESDSDSEPTPANSTITAPKKKKAIQQDLTADIQSRTPESTTDFERLLLGSPNSSFLWIQYMSFQLQISEIDKAREIGRRALKIIGFREEGEKLNVWVALMNLENAFGTEESLEKVAKEAQSFNDPKTVLLRLAGIFEQSDKFEVRPFSLVFVSLFE